MAFIHFYSVFASMILLINIAVCIRVFKIAAIVTDKPDGHRQTRHRQKAVTAGQTAQLMTIWRLFSVIWGEWQDKRPKADRIKSMGGVHGVKEMAADSRAK